VAGFGGGLPSQPPGGRKAIPALSNRRPLFRDERRVFLWIRLSDQPNRPKADDLLFLLSFKDVTHIAEGIALGSN